MYEIYYESFPEAPGHKVSRLLLSEINITEEDYPVDASEDTISGLMTLAGRYRLCIISAPCTLFTANTRPQIKNPIMRPENLFGYLPLLCDYFIAFGSSSFIYSTC